MPPRRLFDQVREAIRVRHYSRATGKACRGRIRRFNPHQEKRHPGERGAPEVERFLSSPVARRNVAASTQNQALSAMLLLCRTVFGIELPWMDKIVRAKRRRRAPAESSRGVPGPLGCNPHFRKHRVCRKIRACRNHHRIVSDCPPGLLPAGAAVISQTGRRSWRAMRGCSTRSRATRRSTARPMPPRSRAGARR